MICRNTATRIGNVLAIGFLAVSSPASVQGQQLADQTPEQLQGVDVVQKLGDALPLQLEFLDESGQRVTLGDYFQQGKPVLIAPVYYNCPMLCTLVLNGLVDGMQQLDWSVGEEFTIVAYSIDHLETPELARAKQQRYLKYYGRDSAEHGWHFLTGDQEAVETLSDAIGFYFKRQPDGLIAHSASVVFVTPNGVISKYMNDVQFQPRDLRFALVEASEGSVGTPMDRFLLFTCLQFDSESNRYGMAAWKLMRSMGLLTVAVIVVSLVVLFRRGSDVDRLEGASVRVPATNGMQS